MGYEARNNGAKLPLATMGGGEIEDEEYVEAGYESGSPEEKWGKGYTADEYDELERIYQAFSSDYPGVTSGRILYNLRKASELQLKQNQATRANDFKAAKACSDMIKTTLEVEGMKAGDAKPLERFNVDGLAERLEAKGAMKDGIFLLDGVVNYIKNDFGKFEMSKDAIDGMMLIIINAMRTNNGQTELSELAPDMVIKDNRGQFLDRPTKTEKAAMLEVGVVPNQYRIENDDRGGEVE